MQNRLIHGGGQGLYTISEINWVTDCESKGRHSENRHGLNPVFHDMHIAPGCQYKTQLPIIPAKPGFVIHLKLKMCHIVVGTQCISGLHLCLGRHP